ncbi:MAG TPA: nitrite/sulfite reductase [Thermoleophilia bacterium]|nr:nitrite/sulfite reductase [Thermoleophilia bacterium]
MPNPIAEPLEADPKLPAIERIKARKNGLDVLADIYRYAELGFDAIEPDDLALFRWYGIYTQRAQESAESGDPGPSEETDGYFMLRIKFPGGAGTSAQLRTIGLLSERYGRGMGDITTRQNIQLHWLALEDLPVVLDEPNAVGLSFTQACGDVWRNVVGCPLAGLDGHELIDSRPLIAELERTFVGDRRFSNLPRKFKVSVSSCAHRCAQHEINDIGLVAVEHDGRIGYDLWVGGGLGASARMGRRLDVFVLQEEAAEVCAVITEIFRDEGKRTKRTRARIKFLVDDWGPEKLRAEVERRLERELSRSTAPADPIDPHRDHLGVHPQLQPGLYALGATTLRGRFSASQMLAVADIADRFGSGQVRFTNRQNVIVTDVADADVDEAAASLADAGLPTSASTFRRGTISCTGMEFCKLAIVETKQRAAELIAHLERRIGDVPGGLRINLNGCPNACAQYQIADIGLQGGIARLADGSRVQGFIVHIGGRLGEHAGFGRRVSSKALPADDVRFLVERVIRAYAGERRPGDDFATWANAQTDARLAGLVGVEVAREREGAAA